MQKYAEILGNPTNTLKRVFELYKLHALPKKAPRTQKDNLNEFQILERVFGQMPPEAVRRSHIRKFLDLRAEDGAPVRGNREKALLSHVFTWAMERDLIEAQANPCRGVKRNPERSRTRYVTDEEYKAVYNCAPERIQVCMELAYLCAMRKSEVLDLMRTDLTPDGITIRRKKDSKDNLVLWSPRLEAAVNRALAMKPTSMYIIHDKSGMKVKTSSFDTAWQRLKAGFTFHDLKAKGVSDSTHANPAGHKSNNMVQLYRRKPEQVEPPE